jgi:hypothetical protein
MRILGAIAESERAHWGAPVECNMIFSLTSGFRPESGERDRLADLFQSGHAAITQAC